MDYFISQEFYENFHKIFFGGEIMLNYGEALKTQRLISKLTQNQLSKNTGIGQDNISRWENGEVLPNIDFCVQLADFYNISLDELIGRDFY